MNIDYEMNDFLKEIKIVFKDVIEELGLERKSSKLSPSTKYLTRLLTAEYLGIKVKTVDLWARSGKLKRIYIKGAPRFDRDEIDKSFAQLKRYKRAS